MRDNKEVQVQSEETKLKKIQNNRLNIMLVSSLIILVILLVVNAVQHRTRTVTSTVTSTVTITTDSEEVNTFIENRCTSNCEKEYIANTWSRLENGEVVYNLDCGAVPTNLFGFKMIDNNVYKIDVENGDKLVFINEALEEILGNYKDYGVYQEYINSNSDEAVKPIIYIYNNTNNKNLQLSLTLDNIADKDSLVLYPLADKYTDIDNDSINLVWNITTNEDNTITASDNKEYSYIFWEALGNTEKYNFDDGVGYCVKGENTENFLKETLSNIGLTPKEYNEFIVYWLPLMQNNEYNLIKFYGLDKNDIYNEDYTLTVKEDNNIINNQLRVFMIWKSSDSEITLEPQNFTNVEFDRYNGTAIVEWGGSEIH